MLIKGKPGSFKEAMKSLKKEKYKLIEFATHMLNLEANDDDNDRDDEAKILDYNPVDHNDSLL